MTCSLYFNGIKWHGFLLCYFITIRISIISLSGHQFGTSNNAKPFLLFEFEFTLKLEKATTIHQLQTREFGNDATIDRNDLILIH